MIRQFGILNTNIPADHRFYGIPFPGDFLISHEGIIRGKYFLPDYQTRVAASEILLDHFGSAAGAKSVSINAGEVRVAITPSADQAVAGTEFGVAAEFSINRGWHIYGQPLPSNYTATTIVFDADHVAKQSFAFPNPEKVSFPELNETLPVYTDSVRANGKLLLRSGLKPGDYQLKGKLDFQECSDTICRIPQSVPFEIPIRIDAMTAAAPKN